MTIKVTYNVTDVYMSQSVSPVYINVSYSDGGSSGGGVWGTITGTLSNQTDLQTALDGKFDNPTGDTTQYIAGDGSLVAFPITGQAGTLVREVRNNSGATITKGTVVYINGASGNRPTIAKAIATSDATSAQTFGLVQADILNNTNGYIVAFGDLDGLDTSAITEGSQLYLSSTVLGGYTTVKQYAPAHLVYIGVVTRSHPNQGRIEVRIANGFEIDEIHNVSAQTPSNNDGLFYNSTTSLWENKSISTVLGYTPEQPLTFNSPLSRSINAVSIPQATGSVNGFLSATDWTTFNNKQNALGYTPANAATTLTINGVTFDLSANRSWTVAAGISGSGANGQVAYWDGTSSQAGSNNLFWDATNSRLGIGLNSPADTLHLNSGGVRIQNIRASLDNFYTSGVVNGLKIQNTTTNGRTLLSIVPNGTSTLADFWVFNTSDTTTNYSALAWGYELNSTFWGINSISAGTGQTRPIYINATNGQAVASSNISFFTNGNVGIGTGASNSGERLQVTGNVKVSGNTQPLNIIGTFTDKNAIIFRTENGVGGAIRLTDNYNQKASNRPCLEIYGTANSDTLSTTPAISILSSNVIFGGTIRALGYFLPNNSYINFANNNAGFIASFSQATAYGAGNALQYKIGFSNVSMPSKIAMAFTHSDDLATRANYYDSLNQFGSNLTTAPVSASAYVDIMGSTTGNSSLRIRQGTAPTSPNNGDIWFDGTDIKIRIGGVTKTFTLI